MEEDMERTIVEFNNHAAKIYSRLFEQFRNSIRNINRNEEENVFKMQLSKYSLELRKQLEQQIKNLLGSSDPKIYKEVEAVLSAKINYYFQEFILKCNAL